MRARRFYRIYPESGKTITVLYDDGDEVTYGFVGAILKAALYNCEKRGHAGTYG